MQGWIKAAVAACLPQIVIASSHLIGGDGALRALVVGALLDALLAKYVKTRVTFLLASLFAGYLLYVAFAAHNRLVFERLDVFALLLTLGAEFAIVLLAVLVTIGDRLESLSSFFALCFSSSLVLAFSLLSTFPIMFDSWYPFALSFALPFCRVYYEVVVNKGLALFSPEPSLFTSGFGVTSSNDAGARGYTMHMGSTYSTRARQRAMAAGGLVYIVMSYALPIICLFRTQPMSLFLTIPLCLVNATTMLAMSATVLYMLKNGLYLRELSPQMFRQGYIRFSDRAKEQAIIPSTTGNIDSTDGKDKAAYAVAKRRMESFKIGVSLLFRPPTFGDIILSPFIFFCSVLANMIFVSKSFMFFLMPLTALYSYLSSRCIMTGNSMSFYLLLLVSPVFCPFTPTSGALLSALYMLSVMSEGKQFGAYALLTAEYIALTINLSVKGHYVPFLIINTICNLFMSIPALPVFADSIELASAIDEKIASLTSADSERLALIQQQQKMRTVVKSHTILHAISIFFVTLYSRTRGTAFLSALLLTFVGGYYAVTFLIKQVGRPISMSFQALLVLRSIFMVLISLVNTGKLRQVGYRIRGSYLLISFSCFVVSFIALCVAAPNVHTKTSTHKYREKIGQVSVSIVALVISTLLLIFANVVPLFCAGFLILLGYIPQGDPSLLLLTVYKGFHSKDVETYTENLGTMITCRWVLKIYVGAFIWAALLYCFYVVAEKRPATADAGRSNEVDNETRSSFLGFLSVKSVLASLMTALLTGIFLLAPSLLYVYGAGAALKPGQLFISIIITATIALSPLLTAFRNPLLLFGIAAAFLLLLLLVLIGLYPATVIYVIGLVATILAPASIAGVGFVATSLLPTVLNNIPFLYVPQNYLLGLWVASTLAFLGRLWLNRELYIRMELNYLVEQERVNPSFRVKASTDLMDSLWLIQGQFASEAGRVSVRNTYFTQWIGGCDRGLRFLQINVALFIAISCILLTSWNYAPSVIMVLSLVPLLIPAVDTVPLISETSGTKSSSSAAVQSIGGYFGSSGSGFAFNDSTKLQLVTNVCIAVYGSIILRCLYSILRAPMHLSTSAVNVTGYVGYLLYDTLALIICSGLSIVPFTLLTGRPYALFAQLQSVQKQRLLAAITVLICLLAFFATEKSMAFFIMLSSLAMLFEAPFLSVQKHNRGKGIFFNGEVASSEKTIVTMDVPAIIMNS